ncbi:MAG: tRNA pseudouridine(38-40) synthase TruA [Bacteroidia bacterium]|nr:tRNA pseudouridine(38-40) synthase TruA [Bacteroidia bacterium]
MRYVVDIIYKGTHFSGNQTQVNARTVQEEVEKALETKFRQPVKIYLAGRTDAGVHGLQLPVHFDLEEEIHPRFLRALNGILPRDVAGTRVYRAVDPDFNVRFHAVERTYRYQIVRRRNPIEQDFALYVHGPLDMEAMQEAASSLLEYDSFESLCKSGGNNKTYLCDIKEARWDQEGEDKIVFTITANRFLRGMVRATVGTLLMVGRGKIDVNEFRRIIEARDRKQAGDNVGPEGLFLAKVKYAEGALIEIPQG